MMARAVFVMSASMAFAQEFEIRPDRASRFALVVSKTGLLSGKKHLFVFERFQGRLAYDPVGPERSRVDFSVESPSIVCKDNWLSTGSFRKVTAEATGPKMLDVSRHPTMRFTSTGVTRRADGSFDVAGTLTIKDVGRAVSVHVTLKPNGDKGLDLTGSAEVRMKDYGLEPPSAAFGTVGTKNEMQVEFAFTARRD
jgi:polyisoprenoid-binding protein YceI